MITSCIIQGLNDLLSDVCSMRHPPATASLLRYTTTFRRTCIIQGASVFLPLLHKVDHPEEGSCRHAVHRGSSRVTVSRAEGGGRKNKPEHATMLDQPPFTSNRIVYSAQS
jgi:hypothetical protein